MSWLTGYLGKQPSDEANSNNGANSRPRRADRVNYAEYSEEEDFESELNFDSPLTSPGRPAQSPSVSPRALLIPDPPLTEEVLQQVQSKLSDLPEEEVVEEGLIVAHSDSNKVEADNPAGEIMPDNDGAAQPPVKYDLANGEDDGDVYKKLSSYKLEFNKDDPKFWFANFERTIKHYGVKSQITKKEALINLLTKEATEECKTIISLDEDEAGDVPYWDLKQELLKLYGPRPEDCFAKAMSRVLVGKPSTLAKQIINDFCECPSPLQSKCCQKMAFGMWVKNLPTYIKEHISNESFTAANYNAVLDKADKVWFSHRQETPVVTAIKADNAAALAGSNDFENPAVAAMRTSNRGQNRGGRGNSRGSNRGQNRGGRGNNRGAGRGGRGGRTLGTRHPQALEGSCYIHHQFGPEAWSCADKQNCPMKDTTNPRPNNQ